MSLADSLKNLVRDGRAKDSNDGCRTCRWLAAQSPADRKAFDEWVGAGRSQSQLYDVLTSLDYPVSLSGLRNHLKHHVLG